MRYWGMGRVSLDMDIGRTSGRLCQRSMGSEWHMPCQLQRSKRRIPVSDSLRDNIVQYSSPSPTPSACESQLNFNCNQQFTKHHKTSSFNYRLTKILIKTATTSSCNIQATSLLTRSQNPIVTQIRPITHTTHNATKRPAILLQCSRFHIPTKRACLALHIS